MEFMIITVYNFLFISINEQNWFAESRFCVGVHCTGTCFIQKIYAPYSSLLQGKHPPFSPSPLRLNIFRFFVILSLTQLYRYIPRYFSFRLPYLNISTGPTSDKLDKNSQRMWLIKNCSQ